MKKAYIYIALATILFSTMEITLKKVGLDFNPIQLSLSRFLIGGLLLLPFAMKNLREKEISLTTSDIKQFSFLGFICVVVSMTFYQLAVVNSKASVVAVLFSCNPVFIMIFAYLILKERIYKYNLASLALQTIGIIIIINPINTNLSISGVVFSLLAAAIFGLYGVLGKKACAKFGGIVVTCASFIIGSIQMIIITFVCRVNFISEILTNSGLGIFSEVPLFHGYTLNNLLYVIYVFVFITGLGYVFYFKAMEETSANTVSLVFFLKPILSPILAFIILDEIIPFNMIVGILFILIGSLISIVIPIISKDKEELKYNQ